MFLEHSRSLAMVSTCKAIDIFEMRWSPSTFSWSCLKPPGFDLKEVSVVSPLVEEAVVQYTLENPNYRLDVVSIDFLLGVGRAYTKLTGGARPYHLWCKIPDMVSFRGAVEKNKFIVNLVPFRVSIDY